MLPKTGNLLQSGFEVMEQPTKTYRLDHKNQRIIGTVDGLEAMSQAVFCALNTERFDWLIYSWNYGIELYGLLGKPVGLVKSKLKKRIREALMQDDRIRGVDAFSFESSGRKLAVSFTVHTVFGDITADKEVSV